MPEPATGPQIDHFIPFAPPLIAACLATVQRGTVCWLTLPPLDGGGAGTTSAALDSSASSPAMQLSPLGARGQGLKIHLEWIFVGDFLWN